MEIPLWSASTFSWNVSPPIRWLFERQRRSAVGVFALMAVGEATLGIWYIFHRKEHEQALASVAMCLICLVAMFLATYARFPRRISSVAFEAFVVGISGLLCSMGSAMVLFDRIGNDDWQCKGQAGVLVAQLLVWKFLPLALWMRILPSMLFLFWNLLGDVIVLSVIAKDAGGQVALLLTLCLTFACLAHIVVVQAQNILRSTYDTDSELQAEKDVLQKILTMAFDANFWVAADGDTILPSDGSFDDFMGQHMAGCRLSKFAADGEALRLRKTFYATNSQEDFDGSCSARVRLVHTTLVKSNGESLTVDLYVVDKRSQNQNDECYGSGPRLHRLSSLGSMSTVFSSSSNVQHRMPAFFVCFKVRPNFLGSTDMNQLYENVWGDEIVPLSPADSGEARPWDLAPSEREGIQSPQRMMDFQGLQGISLTLSGDQKAFTGSAPPFMVERAATPSIEIPMDQRADTKNSGNYRRATPGGERRVTTPGSAITPLEEIGGLGLGVGQYRKVREVGRGSQAVVWEVIADDKSKAAMKEINVRGKIFAHRIRCVDREIRILKQLRWASSVVVPIHEGWLSTSDSKAFIVMEFLPSTLAAALRRKEETDEKFSPDVLRRWTVQLTAGVAAIHWVGAVHRDIKPANVLLTDNDQDCKIADLGVSRTLQVAEPEPRRPHTDQFGRRHSADSATTRSSLTIGLGTFGYSSPEILSGWNYSYAVDMYSLGCVLVEMLTLRRPWEIDNEDGKVTEPSNRPTMTLDRVTKYFAAHKPCSDQDEFEAWLQVLCERLLALEASSRPTASRVLMDSELEAERVDLLKRNPSLWRLFKTEL